jgi:hypothetical protein
MPSSRNYMSGMRYFVGLLLFTFAASHGFANSIDRDLSDWWEANHACQMLEGVDGRELSAEESSRACAARNEIDGTLKRKGYCFDQYELAWSVCSAKPD